MSPMEKNEPVLQPCAKQETDAETLSLLSRAKSGEDEAVRLLVERYRPLLEKAADSFSRSGSMETEEARQIARVALYRAARTYETGKNTTFGLYAGVCIQHALVDECRKTGGHVSGTVRWVEDRFPVQYRDAMEDAEQLDRLLERIYSVLSEKERRVFELRYLEYRSFPEIAAMMGTAEKNVRNAETRLRAKLKKRL